MLREAVALLVPPVPVAIYSAHLFFLSPQRSFNVDIQPVLAVRRCCIVMRRAPTRLLLLLRGWCCLVRSQWCALGGSIQNELRGHGLNG